MPYKGDYAGDYYAGDPGFFSDIGRFIGGAAKKVIGAVVGPAANFLPVPQPRIRGFALPPTGVPVPRGFPGAVPKPGFEGGLERALPGGESGFLSGQPYMCGPNGARRGKLNTSTYVTRGGGTSRWPEGLLVHEKGTECVKIRKMNVANVKAFRKAERRVDGLARLSKRAFRWVQTKSPGRPLIRRRKSKRR